MLEHMSGLHRHHGVIMPRSNLLANRMPRNSGFALLEVLVTLVVVALGLLGLAGLQARLQTAEFESYQRGQAVLLLNDMAARMSLNRNAAAQYVGEVRSGACSQITGKTGQVLRDLQQWCAALEGAGETITGQGAVGTLLSGRGCIQDADDGYMITVAWQGAAPLDTPPTRVTCGAGAYLGVNGQSSEQYRRVATTIVRMATL